MNQKHKKELLVRGVMRTTAALAGVSALSAINIALAPIGLMAGYGFVLKSMEITAKKLKDSEVENTDENKKNEFEPNIVEKLENNIFDTPKKITKLSQEVEEKIYYCKEYIEEKKTKLNIIRNNKMLKKQNHQAKNYEVENCKDDLSR